VLIKLNPFFVEIFQFKPELSIKNEVPRFCLSYNVICMSKLIHLKNFEMKTNAQLHANQYTWKEEVKVLLEVYEKFQG